jgi:hypothetical protein
VDILRNPLSGKNKLMEMMHQFSCKNINPFLYAFILLTYSLFMQGTATAQQDQTSGPLPAETVLLSTDRSLYLAGEMIYLSATILESDNFMVSYLSKIIRIELMSSEGKAGIHNTLWSDNGTMAGIIRLPNNLPTGWYRLRAYTSWMRNRGSSLFAYRDLRIINPADAGRLNEYTLNDTLMVSIIAGNEIALTGSPNHCAVRGVTTRGRPVAVQGVLLSSLNDTVTHFSTGDTGWGTLDWIPKTGAGYRIVIESDPGMPVVTTVPQHSENTVSVTISVPLPTGDHAGSNRNLEVTLTGNIPESGIKLLVHRVSSWYMFNEAKTLNNRLTFVIPTADLPDGLIAFSFLNNDNNTLASALWLKGDPFAGSGTVTTKPVSGDNSTDLLTEYRTGAGNVEGYYTLTTRRREPVEIPDLFIAAIPGWHTTWDIPADRAGREGWLIANGYESFVAESFFKEGRSNPSIPLINFHDIIDIRQSMVEFVPETRGIKLSGTLIHENGTPAGFHILSLTGLNDNLFITTRTFSDGRFHFAMPGREGSKDLLLSHTIRPDEEMSLSISPEFDPRLSGLPPKNIYLTDAEKIYVNDLIIDCRLSNIYRDTSVNIPAADNRKSTGKGMFYGNPDRVIYIDDYIKLPDMRELIFEVVPFVNVKREGDDFSLKIISEIPFPRNYDPLILIDGIPLLRFRRFLELPPERFERIDIINSIYIHGNQIFAGVVNFLSANGDMAGLDFPEGSRILSLDIPGPPLTGELVTPSPCLSDIPSMERTLSYISLSNPSDGSLSYNGNPANGSYITVFTGITGDGKWVNSSSIFDISGSYIR